MKDEIFQDVDRDIEDPVLGGVVGYIIRALIVCINDFREDSIGNSCGVDLIFNYRRDDFNPKYNGVREREIKVNCYDLFGPHFL